MIAVKTAATMVYTVAARGQVITATGNPGVIAATRIPVTIAARLPFGRFAQFEYNPDGYLVRITDMIGMTSEFQDGATDVDRIDFITAMTTPYGTTTFSNGESLGHWSRRPRA